MSDLNHQEKMDKYSINKKSAFVAVMMAIFIDVLGYSMILPLLPSIAQGQFGASNFMVGILIASNALAAFIFAPIWGKLSDHYGRKPMLLISQAGTLASFLSLGFSNSLEAVFFARILDGIFGGQIPIIRAYIVDITDAKTRTGEMAKITGAMAFGMIFGPAIGGLAGTFNWRYPSFIASVLSCITILLTIRRLKESMPYQRRMDIDQRKQDNIQKNIPVKSILTNKTLLLRLAQFFMIIIVFIMINSSFPLVLGLRYGLDVAMIGIFASILGIIMLIAGGTTRKLVEKKGERAILLVAIALLYVAFFMYPVMYYAWMLWIFAIPYAFSNLIVRTVIMTNISKAVEEDKQGIASGWSVNAQSIAQVFAPIIAYWYLELEFINIGGVSIDAYFLIGITCVLICLALTVLILYDLKKNPEIFASHE